MVNSKKSLLIVDDDTGINKMLSFLFQAKGFIVQCAESGKDALHRLEKFEPHAIILDLNMPEMSGLELCERIKKDPDYKNIPVIFLSAAPSNMHKDHAFSLGAFDYLEKPFTTKNLVERVNAAIN